MSNLPIYILSYLVSLLLMTKNVYQILIEIMENKNDEWIIFKNYILNIKQITNANKYLLILFGFIIYMSFGFIGYHTFLVLGLVNFIFKILYLIIKIIYKNLLIK